jgi:hypothetical protein
LEESLGCNKTEKVNFKINRHSFDSKRSASQGRPLDGDEVNLIQFVRVLGGVLLALSVSSCGSVVATQQTTTTSTVALPVEPPQWGVPTDQKPIFFYASDIPQRSRDRVEETFQKATQYWPNYGPLEVWVTGIQTMPIFNMINEYCDRRSELKQMNKFTCLDKNRNGSFEEYRKWSAIDAIERDHRMQGQLTHTAKYGFLQIILSNPAGFTDEFSEYAVDDQQLIFHEYFHVIQYSAFPSTVDIDNNPANDKKFFGPAWFSEGSAEFMSLRAVSDLRLRGELPLYEGELDDLNFHDAMVGKLDAAKATLLRYKNLKLSDAAVYDSELSPYNIGAWAIAYLVHKTSPNVLLDTFYPNIAQLGWAKTFKLAFGMSPAEFEKEFMRFMKLTTDEQTPILQS